MEKPSNLDNCSKNINKKKCTSSLVLDYTSVDKDMEISVSILSDDESCDNSPERDDKLQVSEIKTKNVNVDMNKMDVDIISQEVRLETKDKNMDVDILNVLDQTDVEMEEEKTKAEADKNIEVIETLVDCDENKINNKVKKLQQLCTIVVDSSSYTENFLTRTDGEQEIRDSQEKTKEVKNDDANNIQTCELDLLSTLQCKKTIPCQSGSSIDVDTAISQKNTSLIIKTDKCVNPTVDKIDSATSLNDSTDLCVRNVDAAVQPDTSVSLIDTRLLHARSSGEPDQSTNSSKTFSETNAGNASDRPIENSGFGGSSTPGRTSPVLVESRTETENIRIVDSEDVATVKEIVSEILVAVFDRSENKAILMHEETDKTEDACKQNEEMKVGGEEDTDQSEKEKCISEDVARTIKTLLKAVEDTSDLTTSEFVMRSEHSSVEPNPQMKRDEKDAVSTSGTEHFHQDLSFQPEDDSTPSSFIESVVPSDGTSNKTESQPEKSHKVSELKKTCIRNELEDGLSSTTILTNQQLFNDNTQDQSAVAIEGERKNNFEVTEGQPQKTDIEEMEVDETPEPETTDVEMEEAGRTTVGDMEKDNEDNVEKEGGVKTDMLVPSVVEETNDQKLKGSLIDKLVLEEPDKEVHTQITNEVEKTSNSDANNISQDPGTNSFDIFNLSFNTSDSENPIDSRNCSGSDVTSFDEMCHEMMKITSDSHQNENVKGSSSIIAEDLKTFLQPPEQLIEDQRTTEADEEQNINNEPDLNTIEEKSSNMAEENTRNSESTKPVEVANITIPLDITNALDITKPLDTTKNDESLPILNVNKKTEEELLEEKLENELLEDTESEKDKDEIILTEEVENMLLEVDEACISSEVGEVIERMKRVDLEKNGEEQKEKILEAVEVDLQDSRQSEREIPQEDILSVLDNICNEVASEYPASQLLTAEETLTEHTHDGQSGRCSDLFITAVHRQSEVSNDNTSSEAVEDIPDITTDNKSREVLPYPEVFSSIVEEIPEENITSKSLESVACLENVSSKAEEVPEVNTDSKSADVEETKQSTDSSKPFEAAVENEHPKPSSGTSSVEQSNMVEIHTSTIGTTLEENLRLEQVNDETLKKLINVASSTLKESDSVDESVVTSQQPKEMKITSEIDPLNDDIVSSKTLGVTIIKESQGINLPSASENLTCKEVTKVDENVEPERMEVDVDSAESMDIDAEETEETVTTATNLVPVLNIEMDTTQVMTVESSLRNLAEGDILEHKNDVVDIQEGKSAPDSRSPEVDSREVNTADIHLQKVERELKDISEQICAIEEKVIELNLPETEKNVPENKNIAEDILKQKNANVDLNIKTLEDKNAKENVSEQQSAVEHILLAEGAKEDLPRDNFSLMKSSNDSGGEVLSSVENVPVADIIMKDVQASKTTLIDISPAEVTTDNEPTTKKDEQSAEITMEHIPDVLKAEIEIKTAPSAEINMEDVSVAQVVRRGIPAAQITMTGVPIAQIMRIDVSSSETTNINESAAETTSADVLAAETTSTDVSAAKTTNIGVPAAETTSTDISAAETTSTDVSAAKTTIISLPAAETTSIKVPAAETTSADNSAAETTSTDVSAAETTIVEVPAAETTSTDISAAKTTSTDVSGGKTTNIGLPAAETTSIEVPAAETTSTDISAAKTTSADVSAAETTIVEVPAAETTSADVSAAKTTNIGVSAAETKSIAVPAAETTSTDISVAETTSIAILAAETTSTDISVAETTSIAILAAETTSIVVETAGTTMTDVPAVERQIARDAETTMVGKLQTNNTQRTEEQMEVDCTTEDNQKLENRKEITVVDILQSVSEKKIAEGESTMGEIQQDMHKRERTDETVSMVVDVLQVVSEKEIGKVAKSSISDPDLAVCDKDMEQNIAVENSSTHIQQAESAQETCEEPGSTSTDVQKAGSVQEMRGEAESMNADVQKAESGQETCKEPKITCTDDELAEISQEMYGEAESMSTGVQEAASINTNIQQAENVQEPSEEPESSEMLREAEIMSTDVQQAESSQKIGDEAESTCADVQITESGPKIAEEANITDICDKEIKENVANVSRSTDVQQIKDGEKVTKEIEVTVADVNQNGFNMEVECEDTISDKNIIANKNWLPSKSFEDSQRINGDFINSTSEQQLNDSRQINLAENIEANIVARSLDDAEADDVIMIDVHFVINNLVDDVIHLLDSSDVDAHPLPQVLETTTIADTDFDNMESTDNDDDDDDYHCMMADADCSDSRLERSYDYETEDNQQLKETTNDGEVSSSTSRSLRNRFSMRLRQIKEEKLEIQTNIKQEFDFDSCMSNEQLDVKPVLPTPEQLRKQTKEKKKKTTSKRNKVYIKIKQKKKKVEPRVEKIMYESKEKLKLKTPPSPPSPKKKRKSKVKSKKSPKKNTTKKKPSFVAKMKVVTPKEPVATASKKSVTISPVSTPRSPVRAVARKHPTRASLPLIKPSTMPPTPMLRSRSVVSPLETFTKQQHPIVKKPKFTLPVDKNPPVAPVQVIKKRNVAVKSTTPRPKQRNIAVKRGKPYVKGQGPAPIYGVFVDTSHGQDIDMFINENDDDEPSASTHRKNLRPSSRERRKRPIGRDWTDNYEEYHSWSPPSSPIPHKMAKVYDKLHMSSFVKIEKMPELDRLLPVVKKPAKKIEPNVCELCEPKRIFLSKKALADHIGKEHLPGEDGETTLSIDSSENSDLTICITESTDTCLGCKKKFHSKNRLIEHIKTCRAVLDIPIPPIPKAPRCDFSVPGVDLSALSRSITISKVSQGKKGEVGSSTTSDQLGKFVCPQCGRQFLMQSGLVSHMTTHRNHGEPKEPAKSELDPLYVDGQMKNSVDEGNEGEMETGFYVQTKTIRRGGKIVMRIRREKKMYECKKCKAVFNSIEYLEKHEKLHGVKKSRKAETDAEFDIRKVKREREESPDIEIIEEKLARPPKPPSPQPSTATSSRGRSKKYKNK